MDIAAIIELTREYGGEFGVNHGRRLIHMADLLAEGAAYDRGVIELAAYLHDWGGWAKWAVPGVEHYTRSKQVAEEFLPANGCPPELARRVIECIEYHHGGPADRSIESRLFTDADALDLLGVVGALRVFSMCPRNLRAGWDALQRYRDMSIAALTLDKSKQIAAARIEETRQIMTAFQDETYGMF